jgi:hypothetical protein
MKTSSAKAKGRGLQQRIRDMYRAIGKCYGLQDDDIESRGMGQQGVDIILTPRARDVFNHQVECKKHKRVAVPTHFEEHYAKYRDTMGLKLLYHENDRSPALVTLRVEDFMSILEELIHLQHKDK